MQKEKSGGSASLCIFIDVGWFERLCSEFEDADLVERGAERGANSADLVLREVIDLQAMACTAALSSTVYH